MELSGRDGGAGCSLQNSQGWIGGGIVGPIIHIGENFKKGLTRIGRVQAEAKIKKAVGDIRLAGGFFNPPTSTSETDRRAPRPLIIMIDLISGFVNIYSRWRPIINLW
jgi:hypothetical protein